MTNFPITDRFVDRHIGPDKKEVEAMLKAIGVDSIQTLIDQTIPSQIRLTDELNIPEGISEHELLNHLLDLSTQNQQGKCYIGQGYHPVITPATILRNVFQNPGWYTQYTPYQAEISQGRLEALLNFQTVISDLTGLEIANASLLDEGSAAAEAMIMFYNQANKRKKDAPRNIFFIDEKVFEETVDVISTRADALQIEIVRGSWKDYQLPENAFGALLQYPDCEGSVNDYSIFAAKLKEKNIQICVAADLLSLCLLRSPGSWGADVVVGNSQRFGVPMGFGGPHAAFFATHDTYKRMIPGRIIGVSEDQFGNTALRMALQTREQHIKREKATSNICTAQALLAVMAGMYAVYHGPKGLKNIALRIHHMTSELCRNLDAIGFASRYTDFFDTIFIPLVPNQIADIKSKAEAKNIVFRYSEEAIRISLNECTSSEDLKEIVSCFGGGFSDNSSHDKEVKCSIPLELKRQDRYLEHPVFNSHHSESKMMRYIKSLENKDLSLVHSMIPLGSCTMKLNAAAQLIPVTYSGFSNLHPYSKLGDYDGYQQIFDELETYLSEITGFKACSLQPNSGAQGEYAGLLTIRSYHLDRGNPSRKVILIPSSAHGTNPASAIMAGQKVVITKCDDAGNIDLVDLKAKAEQYQDTLAGLMVTYPSTHGVFEEDIREICDTIHHYGGLVYMDGANMNAQVGLTSPAMIGADVCHLNLHKTFAIPHGGGGPGMGPICVNEKLEPYLPKHKSIGTDKTNVVASAAWGSASILLISYAYIKMLGVSGLKKSTEIAILNSNYIRTRLEGHYEILYGGKNGRSAHEMIVDLNAYKEFGISAEDVAKRLMDYSFHAPTLSFPVAGTIMIEPTESEGKDELDRFCDAMISIKKEIMQIQQGEFSADNNVLKNAPHTLQELTATTWIHSYTREKAAYPLPYLKGNKFWASVKRVNNALGDRNLICTCAPVEAYMEDVPASIPTN